MKTKIGDGAPLRRGARNGNAPSPGLQDFDFAFKRMQKFQTKSMIYGDLANEYACLRDIGKHNNCLNESIHFKALVKNIKDHIK